MFNWISTRSASMKQLYVYLYTKTHTYTYKGTDEIHPVNNPFQKKK